jgi:hypothetical protein
MSNYTYTTTGLDYVLLMPLLHQGFCFTEGARNMLSQRGWNLCQLLYLKYSLFLIFCQKASNTIIFTYWCTAKRHLPFIFQYTYSLLSCAKYYMSLFFAAFDITSSNSHVQREMTGLLSFINQFMWKLFLHCSPTAVCRNQVENDEEEKGFCLQQSSGSSSACYHASCIHTKLNSSDQFLLCVY